MHNKVVKVDALCKEQTVNYLQKLQAFNENILLFTIHPTLNYLLTMQKTLPIDK